MSCHRKVSRWMRVSLTSSLVVFAVLCFLAPLGQGAEPVPTSNVTTVVIGSVEQGTTGPLLVYLYNSKESWLEPEKAFRQEVLKASGKSEIRWTLKGLPIGNYAVQVVHDEDSNGALTMGFFGPSEGVGVSKYVPSFIPSFDKAKFQHRGHETMVRVEMNY